MMTEILSAALYFGLIGGCLYGLFWAVGCPVFDSRFSQLPWFSFLP